MSAQVFFMPLAHEPVYEPVHRDKPANKPDNRLVGTPVHRPVDPDLYLPFTPKQGTVLLHLIQSGGIGNREQIALATGVTVSTVKHSLRLAAVRGFIVDQRTFCQGGLRGFDATLDPVLCGEYLGRFLYKSDRSVDAPVHRPVPPSSSFKSLKTKNLTTGRNRPKPVVTVVEADNLLCDPELGYWRDKGVNGRQLSSWSEEFKMPIDQVIQSLKYCRYDMLVLNQEEEKQISKPLNWFYKVMQRSGLYPKPAKYKSLAEIRAEQMEQAAREAAEARERQRAAEQELAFQRILSAPDSAEYQALFAQVSGFAREMGGKALEIAMKEAFDALMLQPQGLSASPG